MKKIITVLAMFALLTACSKQTPATTAATTNNNTTTTTPKWYYHYSYKKSGDPTVYAGEGCYTDQDMLNGQQLYGWYAIVKNYPC